MSNYLDIDLNITTEHRRLKDETHLFAKKVLRPVATTLDRLCSPREAIAPDSQFWNAVKRGYDQRLHTMTIPSEYGGLGLKGLGLHVVLEELGWGSADFGTFFAYTGFPFATAALVGRQDLVEEITSPFVAEGNRLVGCWAITDQEHGSDQFMVGTPQFYDPKITGAVTARREGESYIINGAKSGWVANGTIATHALVFLTLDQGKGMAGGGMAFVPLDLPGVTRGEPQDKLGQRALNQGSLVFEGVRIPKRYLLIDSASYPAVLAQTIAMTNAMMGAIFTGVARSAFEMALEYTLERVQGGKKLCEHQLVQKRLFDMFSKVQACRATSRAAMVYNDGTRIAALESSVAAKAFCTQSALEVADAALQLFGSKGLSRDFPIEKVYRDARSSLIENAPNELLALVGAQALLGRGQ